MISMRYILAARALDGGLCDGYVTEVSWGLVIGKKIGRKEVPLGEKASKSLKL